MFYRQNLNRWKGWGSTPKQGDIGPWNEMLDFLFAGGAEHRKYFEQHTAYPIQYPGAKLATTVVLYSQTQGVGHHSRSSLPNLWSKRQADSNG
jgi:hypothetical protein